MKIIIITNNPYVNEKINGDYLVKYYKISYKGLLEKVKRYIEEGHKLLSHPLSGSVKPNETPYKSVIISKSSGAGVDINSLKMIIAALDSCEKFGIINKTKADNDFQLIDFSLVSSALESVNSCNV